MTTTAASRTASETLWTTWQAGAVIDALPVACRPSSRAEGYAIQALIEARSAKPVAGWKIAATSTAGQKHINVSGPLAGRMLAERTKGDGATVSMRDNRMAVAEPEFVFVFGKAIAPRATPYTVDEVMASVGDLRLGIELPDSRYAVFTGAGEAQLIADNACAHDMVLGPVARGDWRALDLAAHRVHAIVKGTDRSYERDGIGSNVLGDPRIALAWLVNEVTSLGLALEVGQYVTTGACVPPLEVVPGDHVTADFGSLGTVTVQLTA